MIRVLPFLNNPKDLDLSYKTDLDFWKVNNSVLQPKKYGVYVRSPSSIIREDHRKKNNSRRNDLRHSEITSSENILLQKKNATNFGTLS